MTMEPTPAAAVLTDIMLAVFRVNGRLLEKGDRLVEPLGLTSARWQVLGAIALAGHPLSAPQIGEAMGVTRQGVQKQLNLLEEAGLLERSANPRHQRSPLYALTDAGQRTFDQAMALEAAWANQLSAGMSLPDLERALQILNAVHQCLDSPLPQKGAEA